MSKYNYKFETGDGIWFTSDLHFLHKNIINYCNRPFKDVNDMADNIIKNWNSIVNENDTVFILGDVGLGSLTKLVEYIKRLNGKKILIPGNHDRGYLSKQAFIELFDDIIPQVYIKIDKYNIYLSHFPFLAFDGSYAGCNATWQLFGHCHSFPGCVGLDAERLLHLFPSQYDVGMDNNNYKPISFNEVEKIIKKQEETAILEKEC